jgi:hypothetical protein
MDMLLLVVGKSGRSSPKRLASYPVSCGRTIVSATPSARGNGRGHLVFKDVVHPLVAAMHTLVLPEATQAFSMTTAAEIIVRSGSMSSTAASSIIRDYFYKWPDPAARAVVLAVRQLQLHATGRVPRMRA